MLKLCWNSVETLQTKIAEHRAVSIRWKVAFPVPRQQRQRLRTRTWQQLGSRLAVQGWSSKVAMEKSSANGGFSIGTLPVFWSILTQIDLFGVALTTRFVPKLVPQNCDFSYAGLGVQGFQHFWDDPIQSNRKSPRPTAFPMAQSVEDDEDAEAVCLETGYSYIWWTLVNHHCPYFEDLLGVCANHFQTRLYDACEMVDIVVYITHYHSMPTVSLLRPHYIPILSTVCLLHRNYVPTSPNSVSTLRGFLR